MWTGNRYCGLPDEGVYEIRTNMKTGQGFTFTVIHAHFSALREPLCGHQGFPFKGYLWYLLPQRR